MNDPLADAISLANLANVEGPCSRPWGRDAMFVSQPFYRRERDRLLCCRGDATLAAQHRDDFIVMMFDCQFSNARYKRRRIADCISAHLRQLDLQSFGF